MTTTPTVDHEVSVDHDLIRRLAASWPNRAMVRSDRYAFDTPDYTDPTRPDYPIGLVPFRDHPRFVEAAPEQQAAVLTWGWLAYNERTVRLEEELANPAFALIMHGAFAGATDLDVRKSVQQCLIDEHFHTYMHMVAIHDTRRFRRLDQLLDGPIARPARRLRECRAQTSDAAEQACISLAFGVVAELSVKEFLNLMSEDDTIQPAHRRIALLHNRDEAAHGRVLGQVAKVLWREMGPTERRWFIGAMPAAVDAFVAQDFSTWRAILDHVGVVGAREMILDTEEVGAHRNMVTVVTDIKQLLAELGALDQVRESSGLACLA